MMGKLRKLRGRSFHELTVRTAQKVAAELEHRGLARDLGEPKSDALRSILSQRALDAGFANPITLLENFRSRQSPEFLAGVRGGATAARLHGSEWAAAREHLITAADRVLAGKYDMLGYVGLDYGADIDWHLDPVSGKRGPAVHWSRVPYLDATRVGDHKVVWEINRHQHLVVLGRAWKVSGHAPYAAEFAKQVSSWMDANPPKRGINWASSLEVSYRSISWIWAMELFRDAPELSAPLLARMLKYLHVHARHLEQYLSTYFSPNTHLTGEALGLLYVGTMLPELRGASRWREHGWRTLVEQLPRQIHSDGVYFEQATYYHRYTADIYLHALLLAERNGVRVPPSMRDRLTLAVDHLADLTRPGGTIPIIGDDDGGRLVNLEERGFTDVRAALAVAAVVLGRPEYAAVAGGATEEVMWLLGPDGVDSVNRIAAETQPSHESRLFDVGGYGVMRDGWGPGAMHAVMDCGPLGALNCGHAHSDTLSVVLSVGECPLIVDPGTFTYTQSPEARDSFRHSAAHNTVTLNGESASVPSGPFSWHVRTDATVDAWFTGSLVDRLEASHQGFGRLSTGAEHRRALWFIRGGYWVVVDTVTSSDVTEAVAHYHAAAGAEVDGQNSGSAVLRVPCPTGWQRLLFTAAGDLEPILWDEDWVSPSYGSRSRAPRARLRSLAGGKRQLVAVICPVGELERASVQELPAERGCLLVVNRQNAHDQLLFSADGHGSAPGLELRGSGVLVRRETQGGFVTGICLFGDDARVEVDGIVMTAAGAAEATRRGGTWQVTGSGRVAASPMG